METWVKGELSKTMKVHTNKDWLLGFARNNVSLFPVSRYWLISHGWRMFK